MEPIKINVNVQLGVTEELYSLLRNLLPEPAVQQQESKTDEASQPAAVINPEPTPEPKKEEAAPAKEEADKEYTEVDVRAAMERTRKRIEGEDYKTNTESEGRKKWHRALSGWFKNTAALCGADKPSELPDSESRRQFIELCAEVKVENDELTTDLPF